jgi:hypothetical protein
MSVINANSIIQMKKIAIIIPLLLAIAAPSLARASIFDELVGAVKDLQKQVVDLVSLKIDLPKMPAASSTNIDKSWRPFVDPVKGFEVYYPSDWSTTTIFAQTAAYKNADAFVRNSRLEFLRKIVKPSSTSVDLAVQDSAIFFESKSKSDIDAELAALSGKAATSTKEIGSSTALYILHSVKTDPAKFAGGSTEKYVFKNGTSSLVAEANYGSDTPGGPVKQVFDKMLLTLRLTGSELSVSTSTNGTSTLAASSTDASLAGTSSPAATIQTAGVELSR